MNVNVTHDDVVVQPVCMAGRITANDDEEMKLLLHVDFDAIVLRVWMCFLNPRLVIASGVIFSFNHQQCFCR